MEASQTSIGATLQVFSLCFSDLVSLLVHLYVLSQPRQWSGYVLGLRAPQGSLQTLSRLRLVGKRVFLEKHLFPTLGLLLLTS